ncbi:MAG: hypothetical protein GFH27_549413n15 [Chloroflexi bacterium AL-W]|nr:hypothetical protein [Chloroflexi bacterium AL-N1]NOK71413.1 hypothetical protein [Chloroflexi bacterium AL-N10]NOK78816.1 hypothetical protein [Chloroflexi bacterium AL-N5]NOK86234.1 hypothetical protein [Chloroflexi bacterium AL-W]NOK93138.1 hypothetical protein [Chloroflexi bacterium AL-N15]
MHRIIRLCVIGLFAMLIFGAFRYSSYAILSSPTATPDLASPSSGLSTSTPLAPTATLYPTPTPPPVHGLLVWHDDVSRNDAVTIEIDGPIEQDTNHTSIVWLANDGHRIKLGSLRPVSEQRATLTYTTPTQENLLALYDRVYITRATSTEETERIVMEGKLDEQTRADLQRLLARSDATPNNVGFVPGLRHEAVELLRHAQFLKEAFDANDVRWTHIHAEHMVNIIHGSNARDADRNGGIQNPGDGFGLLPNGKNSGYIEATTNHVQSLSRAPAATEAMRLYARHTQVTVDNTRQRVGDLSDTVDRILETSDHTTMQQDVLHALVLSEQLVQGTDSDLDAQVEPIVGEGGVLTLYRHAQLMAGIPLIPYDDIVNASLTTEALPIEEPDQVNLNIADNTFSPATITIASGNTITWKNAGQLPHTVTASDETFDSTTMSTDDTFVQQFDQPGTYQYYCTFHGTPDGSGMSGTVIVTDEANQIPTP